MTELILSEKLPELSLEELATRANNSAADVIEFCSASVQSAVNSGLYLLAAKEKVGHGNWLEWLEENWAQTDRTARRYMKAARKYGKSDSLSDLENEHILQQAATVVFKPISEQTVDREKVIVDLLRKGVSQTEIAARVKCGHRVVREVFDRVVMPELLAIDWVAESRSCVVKEISVAKNWRAVVAEMRSKGIKGGATEYVAKTIDSTRTLVDSALAIVNKGCPALISCAEAGDMALSTAGKLALLPHDEQIEKLQQATRKRKVKELDELRSRASILLDQKLGWQQLYGTNGTVFRDLAKSAPTEELVEIVRCFEAVRQWCGAVVASLKE